MVLIKASLTLKTLLGGKFQKYTNMYDNSVCDLWKNKRALFFWSHCSYSDLTPAPSLLPPPRVKTSWPRRSQCGSRLARTPTSCLKGPCSWLSKWALLPWEAQAPSIPPNPTWSSRTLFPGPSLFLCPQSWLSSWAAAWDTQRWV